MQRPGPSHEIGDGSGHDDAQVADRGVVEPDDRWRDRQPIERMDVREAGRGVERCVPDVRPWLGAGRLSVHERRSVDWWGRPVGAAPVRERSGVGADQHPEGVVDLHQVVGESAGTMVAEGAGVADGVGQDGHPAGMRTASISMRLARRAPQRSITRWAGQDLRSGRWRPVRPHELDRR